MATKATIFSDFLTQLGVPHTQKYSDKQFNDMTFKSLFGLSRLLDSYGVANSGWRVPLKGSVGKLPLPCLAQKKKNFVILTGADSGKVTYYYKGQYITEPVEDFEKNWTGAVLIAEKSSESTEPHYLKHHVLDIAATALTWIMVLAFAVVLVYLYTTRGYYNSVAVTALIIVNLVGLTVTSMLMLKSLNVESSATDKVCSTLEKGGCDHILAMDASKFFGLFGWSEVGLGYFSVSMTVLLLFPAYLPWLATANLCCLPFTVWSIWYQKFRAHHWCTLCVITQSMLWGQFFCYLLGGFEGTFNLCDHRPWILLSCYVAAVLLLNKIAQILNPS